MTEKEALRSAFNFDYCGIISIFITKNKNQYVVVCRGCSLFEDGIFMFNKKSVYRFKYYVLQNAILQFNKLVKDITSTVDWFTPDFFTSKEFLININKDVY